MLLLLALLALLVYVARRVFWALRPGDDLLNIYGAHAGAWALITGATGGIGREYALALAESGFNVFAVGGPDDEANGQAANLRRDLLAHAVQCHVVCVDAAAEGAPAAVMGAIPAGASLRVLINNVGVGAPLMQPFQEQLWPHVQRVLQVNVMFTTALTHSLLPRLAINAGRAPGGRSAIVILSSLSALVPAPFIAPYAATKAYLCSLAESLRMECDHLYGKVDVRAVAPGKVRAGATPQFFPTESHVDPRVIARGTLRSLQHPDSVVSPHWPHALQMLFLRTAPTAWLRSIMWRIQERAFERQNRPV